MDWPDAPITVKFHSQAVGEVDVFYREAGPVDAPAVLLLHGFPTAGHMFRDLIPELAGRYRVIAPDLPGFGNTQAPGRDRFAYTFDRLATVINDFTESLGLTSYAIYIFDYGAPVGLRLALARHGGADGSLRSSEIHGRRSRPGRTRGTSHDAGPSRRCVEGCGARHRANPYDVQRHLQGLCHQIRLVVLADPTRTDARTPDRPRSRLLTSATIWPYKGRRRARLQRRRWLNTSVAIAAGARSAPCARITERQRGSISIGTGPTTWPATTSDRLCWCSGAPRAP